MPPVLITNDEDYASEEDSDFSPDAALATEKANSSDEDSEADEPATTSKTASTKRKRNDDEAEDLGFENSGDEAIIGEGVKDKKRRRKKAKAKGKNAEELDDDEGGEGGLIKTRSMRAQERVEKKPLADTSAATIDVDAVWAAMISGKSGLDPIEDTSKASIEPNSSIPPKSPSPKPTSIPPSDGGELGPLSTLDEGPDSMIMIKRTYNFAGKVHTEQKLVSRNSAEAKLYLASQPDPASTPAVDTALNPFTKPKRPPKLARRSVFEPIVEGLLKRTDLHFGVRKESDVELTNITGKEKKLNTVEKSAMDWAGFVDKEGIKDDLDAAGKSKGAYKARQEFLARVEQKKEEEARRARGLPI